MSRITNAHQMKSLALAYMGDTVHDLYVREHLLQKGTIRPQELHQTAVRFVSAGAQAHVAKEWMEDEALDEQEADVFRRGRNAKSGSIPKNTDVRTYRLATAFEAVLGYLYLDGDEDRLFELVSGAITTIEEKEGI
ncbi:MULTISPECIES: Mini-ribonuclease 3 [Salimicrobium]|uniref:Mini-ribonuclease 3 n=3 Tax=Salimicrobium TaxID=351195 RepID=K2H3D7_9BACI|nr:MULTISPECIES: Mini-ribonuclease 3 [Salimicrobium]AKG05614.1 ribonuclease III [Salimicrobium jeotgali]EKE30390.1 ribonuclease MrnC [Salimicrobium jeotgali]MBM7696533.1 ribonuclease-3 family protein [Salimicrobium jeotgali]SDY24303.1 ribonuclease-3 family protein [Salimicrobium album]SIS94049.1 ribonuclease-3 family protein [Salimicrobium salexigens]